MRGGTGPRTAKRAKVPGNYHTAFVACSLKARDMRGWNEAI